MIFFELRQQTDTIQALLVQAPKGISKQMYKFAASINPESIVLVRGVVTKSPIEINATTVKDAEIHIAEVHSFLTTLIVRSGSSQNQHLDYPFKSKMHNDLKRKRNPA